VTAKNKQRTIAAKKTIDQQVSIVFADIHGFSKLSPHQLSKFVTATLKPLARIIEKHKPLVRNTWGDAVFLVFLTANSAAECVLEMRDHMRNTDWSQEGLQKIGMRFALHNAHATRITDPITGRPNAFGEHINHTARLEPVVLVDEIFATEQFKVSLDSYKSPRYQWDAIGKTSFAKDWGEHLVYRLRRANEMALDVSRVVELSKAPSKLEALMPITAQALGAHNSAELSSLLKHMYR
jgi:class 3 adenylate cyclase